MPNGKRAETATDPSSSGEEDAGLKFFDLAATRLDSRKHRSRPPQLPPVVESVGASAEYPGTACMALGTQASRDLGWNRSSWSGSARPPTRGTGVRHRTGSSGGRDSPPGGMSGDIAGLESVVSAEPHTPPKLHIRPWNGKEQVFCGQSRAILPLCSFLSSNVGLREIPRERWDIL